MTELHTNSEYVLNAGQNDKSSSYIILWNRYHHESFSGTVLCEINVCKFDVPTERI